MPPVNTNNQKKGKKLRILFHLPNPDTIYAGKTIFYGYKNAFEDLGHTFKALTPNLNQKQVFSEYMPDVFMTSIGPLIFKYLDLSILKEQKKSGMKVFVNTPHWNSPFSRLRVNETQSLSNNRKWIHLIQSGDFGDVYYNSSEQNEPCMEGFTKTTGYACHTVLLAADKKMCFPDYSDKFKTDISYIGTYLPGKKHMLDRQVKPLFKKYKVNLYGQDWTLLSRILGMIQRGGQYFNLPFLRSFLKQTLQLEDERKIYSSSLVSINIHEEWQKKYLGNMNERTFKIPLSGGFEVVDNVPSIHKYFKDGVNIVVAKNEKEWFEKIDYYVRNPEKRIPIIKSGREIVLKNHTYHSRVNQLLHYI